MYNLLDFFGGLVLLFSTRDKYKCFATSVLVIFMIVELYATFFFGVRGGSCKFDWGRRKIPDEIVEFKFMILYSLLYTVNVSVKYALDLDNHVMYVFIFILVIELICIMI